MAINGPMLMAQCWASAVEGRAQVDQRSGRLAESRCCAARCVLRGPSGQPLGIELSARVRVAAIRRILRRVLAVWGPHGRARI